MGQWEPFARLRLRPVFRELRLTLAMGGLVFASRRCRGGVHEPVVQVLRQWPALRLPHRKPALGALTADPGFDLIECRDA